MELGSTGWIILGTRFRCRGVPAAARPDLSALLQGFARPASGDPPGEVVELRVEDGETGSVLAVDGSPRGPASEGVPLGSQIEHRLINEAIARARDRWVLHAGAVEGPRGTCLIIGESGAGKTSLTLWLWASGLPLVTDDLCPLAHGTLAPERFGRALHMDGSYSPLLLTKIPPRPPAYPADYYPFPEDAAAAPRPVTDLLVIERGPRPDGELEPLGQSEAAHRLLRAVIKSPSFEFGRALEDMIRLSSRCRAWCLRSCTPEGAAARALQALAA